MSYKYHPLRFYCIVFSLTWFFWISAIFIEPLSMVFMFLGLCVPALTALIMIFTSKSSSLKNDLKRKLLKFYCIHPTNILSAIVLFACIVLVSIGLSLLLGQSINQFAFTDGFSFSIQGSSALLTILLASVIEEVGWRGYGEDAIAQTNSWFKESILFGLIWSLWHLPLFFIASSYHAGLADLGLVYVLNFLISVIPLGFITTWVYVKNNRSMLACILFHLFVNFFQEKIAMTPETKCIETLIITLVAVYLVWHNYELFFSTKHIGKLPEDVNA